MYVHKLVMSSGVSVGASSTGSSMLDNASVTCSTGWTNSTGALLSLGSADDNIDVA